MVWGGLVLKPLIAVSSVLEMMQWDYIEFLVAVAISNNEILAAGHVYIRKSHGYQISLAFGGKKWWWIMLEVSYRK